MKVPYSPSSRRQFLRQSACGAIGLTGIVNTLAHLKLINGALAANSALSGYKALVVVFLYGGNDSNNMLIPQRNHAQYGNYKSGRGVLSIYDPLDPGLPGGAVPQSLPLLSSFTSTGQYGVHPSMPGVRALFNTVGSGGDPDLAFVANVGTLTQPIETRDEYLDGTVPVPPQLFSHSDQQTQWQSSVPDQPFTRGWGGRIADFLKQTNTDTSVSLSISLSGINSFQVGNSLPQYSVSPTGAIPLAGYGSGYADAMTGGVYRTNHVAGFRLKGFEDIMRHTHAHLLENGYNEVVNRARLAEGAVEAALAAGSSQLAAINTHMGTGTTGLKGQLRMIARLIAGRGAVAQRQIFFCSAGGYDTHAAQMSAHATLMEELSDSLTSFKNAMVALGVHDNVLTITHSDFTRTLTPNSTDANTAGSDHGWGGHQIVMGGAVRGGRVYGQFPPLVVNGGLDVNASRGRWIPTTAVDQYAAVAARWFGDNTLPMSTIFPNLHRFTDVNLAYL